MAAIGLALLVALGVAYQFFSPPTRDPSSAANHAKAGLYLLWAAADAGITLGTFVAISRPRKMTILAVEIGLVIASVVEILLGNVVTTWGVIFGFALPVAAIVMTSAPRASRVTLEG